MTENETKEILAIHYEFLRESWKPYPDRKVLDALRIAISSIDKIQQYRAIGTVEECREARERQIEKKPIKIAPCKSVNYFKCSSCGEFLSIGKPFCKECGNAIDWSDAD